jgi:hypothetical protein
MFRQCEGVARRWLCRRSLRTELLDVRVLWRMEVEMGLGFGICTDMEVKLETEERREDTTGMIEARGYGG